jgi:hypothetical protein
MPAYRNFRSSRVSAMLLRPVACFLCCLCRGVWFCLPRAVAYCRPSRWTLVGFSLRSTYRAGRQLGKESGLCGSLLALCCRPYRAPLD